MVKIIDPIKYKKKIIKLLKKELNQYEGIEFCRNIQRDIFSRKENYKEIIIKLWKKKQGEYDEINY